MSLPAKVSRQQAEELSQSKLVPEHFHKNAANTQYAMEIGHALGLSPVGALAHVHVFDDKKGLLKATLSAHSQVALARAAGHRVHVTGDREMATATLIRGDVTKEDIEHYRLMREEERRMKLARIEDTQRLYEMRRQQILNRMADLKALADMGEKVDDEIAGLRRELTDLHTSLGMDELAKSLKDTSFDLDKIVRFECVWTWARVSKIPSLVGKSTWLHYRPEMLKRAAGRNVVRDGASEVIVGIRDLLGKMGVQYSGTTEEEIAVHSAVYEADELGFDSDEEGAPLETTRPVRRTRPIKQSTMVDAARKTVANKGPEDIAAWAQETTRNGELTNSQKVSRISAVYNACHEDGTLEKEIQQDGEPVTLRDCLTSLLNVLETQEL